MIALLVALVRSPKPSSPLSAWLLCSRSAQASFLSVHWPGNLSIAGHGYYSTRRGIFPRATTNSDCRRLQEERGNLGGVRRSRHMGGLIECLSSVEMKLSQMSKSNGGQGSRRYTCAHSIPCTVGTQSDQEGKTSTILPCIHSVCRLREGPGPNSSRPLDEPMGVPLVYRLRACPVKLMFSFSHKVPTLLYVTEALLSLNLSSFSFFLPPRQLQLHFQSQDPLCSSSSSLSGIIN